MTNFLNNKYTRWYYSIISDAQQRDVLTGYFETHHIIPTCAGGDNDPSNLVKLTAREHIIVHLLLERMLARGTTEWQSLQHAAWLMSNVKFSDGTKYHINSRVYERLRINNSVQMSEYNKKMWKNSEYRAKMTDIAKKSWEDPEYRSIQSRRMSEQIKKMWEDPSYREMKSENNTGENNPRYDHNIYHFIHDNGTIESCTQHELKTKYCLSRSINPVVKGKRKSYKGWRLLTQK